MLGRGQSAWLFLLTVGVAGLSGPAALASDDVAGPPVPSESAAAGPAEAGVAPVLPVAAPSALPANRDAQPLFPGGVKALQKVGPLPSVAGESGLMSMAVPLATVVGLALVCAVVLRKTFSVGGGLAGAMSAGGKSPAGILEVLGRYPISRGQSLVLLRLDRRVLLLSHSQGARGAAAAMSTLAELADPEDVASILLKVQEAEDTSASKQFARLMSQARDGEGVTGVDDARARSTTPDGDAIEMWSDAGSATGRTASIPLTKLGGGAADPVRALRERIAAMKGGANASIQEAAA